MFSTLARRLKSGWASYDSVNHGLSSNSPRGEPEPDRVDELEGFLSNVGIDRPILAGQSMGGMTIARWAIRHPDAARALIISGMGIPSEPRSERLRELVPASSYCVIDGAAHSAHFEKFDQYAAIINRFLLDYRL
jgi:pimeloyl-ACP methyl ester carboxylesterase